MDRILKNENKIDKSKLLKQVLTIIQDTETKIKQAMFHSFFASEGVEAVVLRIIRSNAEKIPKEYGKEKFIKNMMANANNLLSIIKFSKELKKQGTSDVIEDRTEAVLEYKKEDQSYKSLFQYGSQKSSTYQKDVRDLTVALAKKLAEEDFKTVSLGNDNETLTLSYTKLRASAEREIRDKMHHQLNDEIIANNRLVWISAHVDCSERCQKWQGKLYSTDHTSGVIDGIKYVPIEDATNSNWYTTKKGVRINNSILYGPNCRHYTIPYEKGIVPVIKYDAKIIEEERKITSKKREYERSIVQAKLYHKLLVQASKENVEPAELKEINKQKAQAYVTQKRIYDEYVRYCQSNDRAFEPWRCSLYQEVEYVSDKESVSSNIDKMIRSDIMKRVKIEADAAEELKLLEKSCSPLNQYGGSLDEEDLSNFVDSHQFDRKGLITKLGEEKCEMISLYSDPKSDIWRNLNKKLYSRAEGDSDEDLRLTEDEKKMRRSLVSTLNKCKLSQDIVVYRGLSISIEDLKSRGLGLIGYSNPKNGFLSTSLLKSKAVEYAHKYSSGNRLSVIMEIYEKKGTKGVYIESITEAKGEFEILHPYDSRITPLSIEFNKEGCDVYIKAKLEN